MTALRNLCEALLQLRAVDTVIGHPHAPEYTQAKDLCLEVFVKNFGQGGGIKIKELIEISQVNPVVSLVSWTCRGPTVGQFSDSITVARGMVDAIVEPNASAAVTFKVGEPLPNGTPFLVRFDNVKGEFALRVAKGYAVMNIMDVDLFTGN